MTFPECNFTRSAHKIIHNICSGTRLNLTTHLPGASELYDRDLPFLLQHEGVWSVQDALEQLVSKESLQGFTCPKTKQEVEATRRITLETLPPVLVLHLKWFVYDKSGGSQKQLKKVEFTETLDISKGTTNCIGDILYWDTLDISKGTTNCWGDILYWETLDISKGTTNCWGDILYWETQDISKGTTNCLGDILYWETLDISKGTTNCWGDILYWETLDISKGTTNCWGDILYWETLDISKGTTNCWGDILYWETLDISKGTTNCWGDILYWETLDISKGTTDCWGDILYWEIDWMCLVDSWKWGRLKTNTKHGVVVVWSWKNKNCWLMCCLQMFAFFKWWFVIYIWILCHWKPHWSLKLVVYISFSKTCYWALDFPALESLYI